MGIIETYKALADESRLRLVHCLSQGMFNVQELTSVLGLGQSTVSHHLKILHQAGIATSRREGTHIYYTLSHQDSEKAPAAIINNFLDISTSNLNGLEPAFSSDREKLSQILNKRREEAHSFFEKVAAEWKSLREKQERRSYLQELINEIKPDETLLELGCGSGALLEKILPRTGETIGVDYSQAMLNECAENLREHRDSVDLRLGYLEHLPLADASADTAVAYMVMHHLPEPLRAFMDAFRVLRAGGRLIIVDLMEHHDETMRERYADIWLGFN
ncbi:MAG: methyltransferase domain-containing protein, partial [Candidatus Dadabacteria bacterium]